MAGISDEIKHLLLDNGAALVGFADVSILPEDERCGLPIGIAVAVKYEASIIEGISQHPTVEYHDAYNALNSKLDRLVSMSAERLAGQGYTAVARTLAFVGESETAYDSKHPHKTIARLAGLGWIGKSALFVTEQFGSMIRLSSILTNAPMEVGRPMDEPKCGDCMICTKVCPAGAIKGNNWNKGCSREDIFDAKKCRKKARELSNKHISKTASTICGKCINICPYTRRYMMSQLER